MELVESEVVIPLRQVRSVEEAGGKAFNLAELAKNGFPVPETLVLRAGSDDLPGPEILEALGGCVAVRSSATIEDRVDDSFAGQFKSFLNLRTQTAVIQAIRECRESVHSGTVRLYCGARGIDASSIRMAVILQRMVEAEVAGVLFTVHPVSGREDEMLIEACAGTADDLLAGRRTGVQIPVHAGKATRTTDLLSPNKMRQLIEIGRRIQRFMGAPQDIEWAIENDQLYVLQSRPITRFCFGGIDGEWTNADFRDGGVAGDVVTPLMWSLYEFIWNRALKGYLADLKLLDGDFAASQVFYGRPYWNLGAVKCCAVKLPGFIESEFDRDLAVQPKYAGDGIRTPTSLWNLLKALPTVLAARRTMSRQETRDLELLDSYGPRRIDVDVECLNDDALLRCFRQLVEHAYCTAEENYFRTIFCVSIAKLDFKKALGNLPLSYPALVGGLDSLAHFQCAQALWELANERGGACSTLARFLAQYGHHSRRELDLRIPRWSEEATFVVQLARKLVGTESPEEANRCRRRQYAAELERAQRLLSPWKRNRFERKLLRLRNFLWLREQMRDLSTRMYGQIRRFVQEIGRRAAAAGRLHSADDIFYLTFREIYRVFDGSHQDIIESRRDYELMYRSFRPPNEVGRGYAHTPVEHAGRRLSGIGCSTGVVSGRVRVVTSLVEAGKLEPGDILVAPFTDPGWTPLLSIAAGVVTETGGLLSHAAVICREYAIPAVLNVAAATRLLRDDQQVRIDGEMGNVDLL